MSLLLTPLPIERTKRLLHRRSIDLGILECRPQALVTHQVPQDQRVHLTCPFGAERVSELVDGERLAVLLKAVGVFAKKSALAR
jgi:hypothetical protein